MSNQIRIALPFDSRCQIERALSDGIAAGQAANSVGQAARLMRLLMSWQLPATPAVSEDQPKPRAEHVHTEACEHRLVSSEVAGVSECYSCGPGVRDQYCPNACPVVLSEVLADSEQVRHG